jgi:phage-related protein
MMDNKISLRVDLETLSARNELERFKRAVSSFASDTRSLATGLQLNVNASFDDAAARTGIQALRSSLQNSLRIDIGTTQALSELERLKRSVLSFISDTRSLTTGLQLNVNASFDDAAARASIQSFRDSLQSQTVRIRIDVDGAGTASAIQQVRTSVVALTAATAIALPILRDYNDELDRIRTNADTAADAIRRAAEQQERWRRAGGGGGGNGADQRSHTFAVIAMAQAYSGLASKLLIAKSAMAVLTATAAGAAPVLGQMAATVGMAFGTALATANVAAMSKELQKLAENTGTSAQALQSWRLAARFEGVTAGLNELGDVGAVFTDLSEKMDKLGTEDGEDFAKALKAIGLNASEIKAAKPEEALLKIGDALSKIKMSDRDKSAFLAYISKDAANLLPLLQQNAQKFQEIQEYANAVGAIQSDTQLAAMKQTNTELSYFKVGLEGVQTQLAAVGSNVINTLGPNIRQLFIDARAPLQAWSAEVNTTLVKFKADLDNGGWGVAFSNMFQSAYPTLHQFVSSAADFGRGYGQAFVAPMLTELKAAYAGISSSLAGAGGAEALGRGMGEAMQPVIAIAHNVVGAVKLLIGNWSTLKEVASYTPVGFVVANWDKVVSVFTSVGNGIRSVAETFGILNPATTTSASGVQVFLAALGGLLAASASTKLALGLVGAAVSTFAFALGPVTSIVGVAATAAFGALATALGITTAQLKVMAIAALTNPITLTIAAIATGAALLYANWDKVSGWWNSLWSGLKSTVSSAWTSIKASVSETSTSIKQSISKTWTDVSTSVGSAWGSIKQGAASAWTSIVPVVSTGLNAFRQAHVLAFEAVKGLVGSLWSGAASLTKAGLSVISGVAAAGWSVVKQGAELAGNGIKAVVTAWWGAIQTTFSGAWTTLKTIVSTGWEGIKAIFKAATQALQADFTGAWVAIKNGVSSFVSDVIAVLRKTVSDFIGIGKDMLSGLARGIADGANAAINKAKAVGADIYNSVKGFFKIQSPSRLMAGLGVEVSAGLAVGIQSAGGQAVEAAASVSVSIADEFNKLAGSVNDALTGAFMSLDFSNLGSSLSGIFKQQVIQPLLSSALQPLSSGVASLFAGLKNSLGSALGLSGSGGGILSSITSALGLGGSSSGSGLLGSITSGLGALFGGSGSVTGALGGIGSALSGFASALGPIGIAAGAIAAISKIIGSPKGNIVFGQNMQQGQQLTGQGGHAGQEHYRQSIFGLLGATLDSNKIGREKDFVPKFHVMMDQMVALDQMIASAIPSSINNIKAALQGVTQSGFSTSDMLKSRYTAVFSALPEELQKAMQGGKNLMAGTAEEIVARFGLMAAAAQSVVPALDQLGVNTGKTRESAIAAALGLTDLMGGLDKVKESAAFYYQEFFSEEERKAQALRKASADVSAFNQSLGLTGSAAINSHAEFRKYIESLDLTTEAGRKAYAAAMAVAGSMDIVADAYKAKVLVLQQALPALENLNLRIGSTGNSALTAVNGLASLMGGIDNLTKAANTYYDQFFTDEEKKKQALANAAADVDRFNKTLGLSGKNAIDTHAEFKKYIESLDLQTEAGRKAYAEAMKIVGSMDALADTGKSLDEVIGSLPRKLYAKALAMAGLSDAVDKAATGSTDALNDVKRTMTGLGTAAGKTALAIEDFVNKALKAAGLLNTANPTAGKNNNNGGVDGSHASGLGYVPKDGYIAELHKGEMVLTANQAALYRMGTGGNQMAVSVRPQLSIVVNNNASTKVSIKESTDAAGNTTAVMTIDDIETAIADRARRGKGLAGTFATVGRR